VSGKQEALIPAWVVRLKCEEIGHRLGPSRHYVEESVVKGGTPEDAIAIAASETSADRVYGATVREKT